MKIGMIRYKINSLETPPTSIFTRSSSRRQKLAISLESFGFSVDHPHTSSINGLKQVFGGGDQLTREIANFLGMITKIKWVVFLDRDNSPPYPPLYDLERGIQTSLCSFDNNSTPRPTLQLRVGSVERKIFRQIESSRGRELIQESKPPWRRPRFQSVPFYSRAAPICDCHNP